MNRNGSGGDKDSGRVAFLNVFHDIFTLVMTVAQIGVAVSLWRRFHNPWLALFALVALGSVNSFVSYGADKEMAKRGLRRVPEKSLHWRDLFFGWLGGFVGQRFFHHKTEKISFQVIFWLTLVLHFAIIFAVCRYRAELVAIYRALFHR